jgi:hypothetical protein
MPRKTIAVDDVRQMVNQLHTISDAHLAHITRGLTPEAAYLIGAANLLSEILLKSDKYRGYQEISGDHTRRRYL